MAREGGEVSEKRKGDAPLDLGIYGRPVKSRISTTDIVAAVLSVIWIGAIVAFFMVTDATGGTEPLTFVFTALAILLPLAMIWVAATVAKTARVTREEAARLQAALDAMRHTYVVQQQTAGLSIKPSVERKLDEIAETARKTEVALTTFASRRGQGAEVLRDPNKKVWPEPAQAAGDQQKSLELGTPATELADPISVSEFIRALNFPEDENDIEGFRTLRRALADPTTSRLIRASQDILTLLSQDGIYMDDLSPTPTSPDTWRKFGNGVRGREIAQLGAIRDRSCLALTNGRMKKDPVFRDAAHHFLRQFDKVFTEFARNATDEEIAEVEQTRTARAFMLLGRVTGTFD